MGHEERHVRRAVAHAWRFFDANEFLLKVMQGKRTDDIGITVDSLPVARCLASLQEVGQVHVNISYINDIAALDCLHSFYVRSITCSGGAIDLSPGLAAFVRLRELDLRFDNVRGDLSVIGRLTSLRRLFLPMPKRRSIGFLNNLHELEDLTLLSLGKVTDWSPLASCQKLASMTLSGDSEFDISVLQEHRSLIRLSLHLKRFLGDVPGAFLRIPNLQFLNLSVSEGITWDFADLAELPRLKSLGLHGVRVERVPELSGLPITSVGVEGLPDLADFAKCSKLQDVLVYAEDAIDLTPMIGTGYRLDVYGDGNFVGMKAELRGRVFQRGRLVEH
ncbi:hypothetical protein AAH979_39300 [Plantactinospora sp. ZYX-F-223]|uniref:hypothetical protein n=1 Tax=Plantactinospora sp. ZYX-F-223 TaxID=3144103 RepID=UPI0031FD7B45